MLDITSTGTLLKSHLEFLFAGKAPQQFPHGNSISPAASLVSVLVQAPRDECQALSRRTIPSLLELTRVPVSTAGCCSCTNPCCSALPCTKCVQAGFMGPAGILRFLCHEAKWEVWPKTTDGFHIPSHVQETQQPGQTFQPQQIPFFRSPLGMGVRRAGLERILLCPLETL